MTFEEWCESVPSISLLEKEFAKLVWDAAQKAASEQKPDPGRPVRPHRSGGGKRYPPKDGPNPWPTCPRK